MQTTCSSTEKQEFSEFFLKQISTSCLAQFSYYIDSEKEAILIDPMREPDQYVQILNERGSKLKYIFETHFHADFVSGHVELAKLTGAQIVYGPGAKADFEIHSAKDGETFSLGSKIKIKVFHTPGHTLESSCYLILDSQGVEQAVFTGDTVFLNEVGRPDLAAKDSEITEKELAGMMYDSIRNKILPLRDELFIFPGHGAGSACGKKISSGGSDTLKNQRKTNYAFNENLTKEEFIEILTSNLNTPPQYFFYDVMINKRGYDELENIIKQSVKPISLTEFLKLTEEDKEKEIVILDTRDVDDICKGFIPGSVSVTLKTNYASWVGALFSPDKKIILITDEGKEKESVVRLARIGYVNVIGYLEKGVNSWTEGGKQFCKIENIEIVENINKVVEAKKIILDVREKGEWENTGVLPNSVLVSLSKLQQTLEEIPKSEDLYLLCRSGQRTLIAATLLKKNGFSNNLVNLRGGISKLLEINFQFEKYN
jgi:hydroxyacylglutathione hydrolase